MTPPSKKLMFWTKDFWKIKKECNLKILFFQRILWTIHLIIIVTCIHTTFHISANWFYGLLRTLFFYSSPNNANQRIVGNKKSSKYTDGTNYTELFFYIDYLSGLYLLEKKKPKRKPSLSIQNIHMKKAEGWIIWIVVTTKMRSIVQTTFVNIMTRLKDEYIKDKSNKK